MIRTALRAARLAGVLALVGLWIALLRPVALGGPATYLVVRGSSMLPGWQTGDLVILHSAATYRPGDVVAYRVPDAEIGAGHLVFHRILGATAHAFVMEGDNNPTPDPWSPRAGDVVGGLWITLPGVGRLISAVHQPVVLAGLAAAIVVALIVARPARRPRTVRSPATG